MSLSDYYTEDAYVYTAVNSGTHIIPVITWTLTDTIKCYWEVASGFEAVTNTNSEIKADISMLCAIADIMDYNTRIKIDSDIYSIAFIDPDPSNRVHHAEIMLKRMPKNTITDMGI